MADTSKGTAIGSGLTWAVGLAAVLGVIVGQFIFPFAFDFVTTLGVYGLGVYMGSQKK